MNMENHSMTRRMVLGGISILALTTGTGLAGATSLPAIVAYRNPGCGCCEKWAEQLKAAGFEVSMQDDPDLSARRVAAGVPEDLAGCHTAVMGDYVIEGHVPLADILRLLTEKPKIKGIAVPGMPMGSPGMEMGEMRDAYDVVAFATDGSRIIFAKYAANP
jgi:hypothetical protein